jgi:hypothetical protein
MVLPDRIELSTFPLPRECSTTELRQRCVRDTVLRRLAKYTRATGLARRQGLPLAIGSLRNGGTARVSRRSPESGPSPARPRSRLRQRVGVCHDLVSTERRSDRTNPGRGSAPGFRIGSSRRAPPGRMLSRRGCGVAARASRPIGRICGKAGGCGNPCQACENPHRTLGRCLTASARSRCIAV